MKRTFLFTSLIFIYGCSLQNPREKEIFEQADTVIKLMQEKDYNSLTKSARKMRYGTNLTDTGWINYASPLLKKYLQPGHKSWKLVKTDMGYEVHIPLSNLQEPDDIYRSYDFVLLHTPDWLDDKFYDFRLDGDLNSAKQIPTEAPK